MPTVIPRKITPAKVIEAQSHMGRTMGSDDFARVFWSGVEPFLIAQGVERSEQRAIAGEMARAFGDIIINGEAVLIRDNTRALIEYAAEVLPRDDTYDTSLSPFREALIFFETPMVVPYPMRQDDGTIELIDIHMSWIAYKSLDEADMSDGIDPYHIYYVGMRFADDTYTAVRSIGVVACSNHSTLGKKSDQRGLDILEKSGMFSAAEREIAVFNPKPFIQAMWAMFSQPIMTETSIRPIEPHIRKMRKKMKNGATVRVLGVRQRVGHGGGGSGGEGGREWSHRWVVRGFWRMQRCGPKGAERKRIWVDSYVKGPADKPLLIGDKVYRE